MEKDLTIEGLAHDLNNVFETILEAAEALGHDAKSAKLAAAIQRSVDRGARLLAGLSQTGRDLVEFDRALENAIQQMMDFTGVTNLEPIEFRRGVESGLRLRGADGAWERVLVNLFLNAARVNPKGCVIEVDGGRAGGTIEIRVANNGPGIPAEILDRIFDPGVSTKKARSRAARSGLGLHIVKTLVESNGGQVEARNRTGGGAEFIIAVPTPS